jgi:hypothetical protein
MFASYRGTEGSASLNSSCRTCKRNQLAHLLERKLNLRVSGQDGIATIQSSGLGNFPERDSERKFLVTSLHQTKAGSATNP